MADYLPVLLVSVTNASILPDDSSVSTLPRGQVDYQRDRKGPGSRARECEPEDMVEAEENYHSRNTWLASGLSRCLSSYERLAHVRQFSQ